jgi:hypothetical protein
MHAPGCRYPDRPDWPKMGPSLLIAACLILGDTHGEAADLLGSIHKQHGTRRRDRILRPPRRACTFPAGGGVASSRLEGFNGAATIHTIWMLLWGGRR